MEDPGHYHEPGDNSNLLDIVMEVGMETGLQKTVLKTPHRSSLVEQCLFLESKPPSQVRTVVTRPVGQALLASMLSHDSSMGRRGHVLEDQPNKA